MMIISIQMKQYREDIYSDMQQGALVEISRHIGMQQMGYGVHNLGKWQEGKKNGEWGNSRYVPDFCELGNNRRVQIVQQIAHVEFPCLSILQLSGNEIESVEGMCRMNMPWLEYLWIGNNNIRTIQTLKKARWLLLRVISIKDNYMGDSSALVEGPFPKLAQVWIQMWYGEEKNQLVSAPLMAKGQTEHLTCLNINTEQFCLGRSIKAALQKKWKSAKIR